jgi:hypothetical protein
MFVERSSGLKSTVTDPTRIGLLQVMDRKTISIPVSELEEVLFRSDTEGRDFIQVNMSNGKKILLTDTLIGFKPVALKGLDSTKLPRVVTTPDIMSVFEAIEDSLHSSAIEAEEIKVLKRIYEAVVAGGEAVGFDLSTERSWVARIPLQFTKAVS